MNPLPNWTAFLNSLATRGGAIFVLLFLTAIVDIGAFIVYLRHDIDAHGLVDIVGSGAIIGALLLALKGSSETSAVVSTSSDGSTRATAGDSVAENKTGGTDAK